MSFPTSGMVHIQVEQQEPRLDQFLSRFTGESRMFIKRQIENGRVSVNGSPCLKGARMLSPGDKIEGQFEEMPRPEVEAIPHALDILHEDEDMIVLNKPQGMVVHPAQGHRGETLVHYLMHHLKKSPDFLETSGVRPGIVHRLDRGTSGVLLIAKHRKSLENLAHQFKERLLQKTYEAIVWGTMEKEGHFDSPIGRHPTHRKKMSSKGEQTRPALTHWKAIRHFGTTPCFTHVALYPKTGRTHQLRVHLTESGHPIVGDPLYGSRGSARRTQKLPESLATILDELKFPYLHAKSLKFTHPTSGKELEISAPRPEAFDNLLKKLGEL